MSFGLRNAKVNKTADADNEAVENYVILPTHSEEGDRINVLIECLHGGLCYGKEGMRFGSN